MFCSTCGAQSSDVDRFCPNCGAALAASLNVAAPAAAQAAFPAQVYAGFWIRVAAALIDWIAIGILNALISAFLTPVVGVLTSLLSGWLYHALLESSENQATFGKMAVGVYVTDLNGQRITFGLATLRHFAKIVSAMILMIGFIMAGFTEKKQALHDMIAGTLVVRR